MQSPGSFSEKLATVLEARNMGARTLARLVDPSNPEQARRAIRRWLQGTHTPTQASRDAVTDALGLERGALDPDDEESARDVLLALYTQLGEALGEKVA